MNPRVQIPRLTFLVCALLLCACASAPPAAPDAMPAGANAPPAERPPPPPGQTRYQWPKASEAEVAAQLDQKFQEDAKSFVQVKRNDQLMFFNKYREMGSSIRTHHCITEAELRKQVEDSEALRAQM